MDVQIDFNKRIESLIVLMRDIGASGALIVPGTNLFYLTGLTPSATLERLFTLFIPCEGEPVLIAPKLYENELKGCWLKNILIWSDSENPYELLNGLLVESLGKGGKLLIDDNMPASHLLRLYDAFRRYDLEPLSPVISKLRIVKSRDEIDLLKEAAKIADRVLEEVTAKELRGMTERKLARLIGNMIVELGAERFSFDPIVASGPNGANPHHTPGDREIRDGDILIIDFGARLKGYCSDITRTFAIGQPSKEARYVYEIVQEAQEAAFQAVKEGIKAREIDSVARGIITSKGYGEYFTHRTGHGLGLDIHEEPYIAPNSETELREGMVFTIEPGIYLEGKFGVRIEDDVAVINGRGERLTKTSREFIVL